MRDGEERERPEMHAFEARPRIERRVEDEMPAFVHRQCERGTGKELHNIDHGMLIRLRWRLRNSARAGLGGHANWKKHREKQHTSYARVTAEDGTHVAF